MKVTNDPFQLSLNQLTEAATARQDWSKCPPTHEEVRAELERRRVAKQNEQGECVSVSVAEEKGKSNEDHHGKAS